MATQKIKKSGIDKISDWTWCRPLPVANTALSAFTSSSDGQYIYYLVGAAFYKYDIINNSWQQIASVPTAPSNIVGLTTTKNLGHTCYAISSGPSNNTIEIGHISEKILVGKKIKIIAGTGSGQERTITSISAPIVLDMGRTTVASVNNAIYNTNTAYNATKQPWINQYLNGYQLRIEYGAGAGSVIRSISYNMNNAAYLYKPTNRRTKALFGNLTTNTSTTQPNWTQYIIESSIATVDSPWNVSPDSTSLISIESEGILLISGNASSPFYLIHYYSSLVDAWFQQEQRFNMFLANPSTDIALTSIEQNNNVLISGTITSSTNRSVTDTSLNLSNNSYNNYVIKIISGTGIGQERVIIANSSNEFFISASWDTNPDNTSSYQILEKSSFYICGNGASSIYEYTFDENFSTNPMIDFGNASEISATVDGKGTWGISSITRRTTSITSLDPIPISSGSGYYIGQILRIGAGTVHAHAKVENIDASGGVTEVSLLSPGAGYTTGSQSTTPDISGGSGCILNVLSIGMMIEVTTNTDNTFKKGEFVNIDGATESVYNGDFEIKYTPYAGGSATFYIEVPSATTNGTAASTHATTRLVDASKNWITNEHVGKLINVKLLSSGFSRIITANTAKTITFATATAPTNTITQYEIVDAKAFGTEKSYGAIVGGGNFGVATGGSTTTLVDSTKNWPINWWSTLAPSGVGSGRKIRIIAGTGAGTEMTIISNTANTITFAAQSFTVDTTSIYEILDNFGVATGGSTTTLIDTTQNWPINSLANRRVRYLSGANAGLEYTITSNTQTEITFATGTAPDTNTAYAILNMPTRGAGIDMFKIKNSSNSSYNKYIYLFRGGGTPEIGRYNIVDMSYEQLQTVPTTETMGSGSMYAYDDQDTIYFTKESTGRIMSYNIITNEIKLISVVPYGMGTSIIGGRMRIQYTNNGDKWLFIARHSAQEMWRLKLN